MVIAVIPVIPVDKSTKRPDIDHSVMVVPVNKSTEHPDIDHSGVGYSIY